MKQPRIKIVSEGNIAGLHTQIFVLLGEGENEQEVDISSCVTKVDVSLPVGELATAKIEAIIWRAEAEATLESAGIRDIRPKPWNRIGRKVRDASTFFHPYRRFV